MKHTPTPWAEELDQDGSFWIVSEKTRSPVCMISSSGSIAPFQRADAELIVRAVNAHDALFRLYNEVMGCWTGFEDGLRGVIGHTNYRIILDKLDAARASQAKESSS